MLLSTEEGVIFTSMAIIAAFQWSVTGIGHAIIFLFLYQFIDFSAVFQISTLKYAIMIQSIAIFSSIIYILIINFKHGWRKFFDFFPNNRNILNLKIASQNSEIENFCTVNKCGFKRW